MLTKKEIYKQGYLDGMKGSGKLLMDVSDEDVQLSYSWKFAIEKAYKDRNYEKQESTSLEKLHLFIRRQTNEREKDKERIKELETLLGECNEIRLTNTKTCV